MLTKRRAPCYTLGMYPYLFGWERLPTYGVCLAVGLLGAMLLFRFLCKKKAVDDDVYAFYSLLGIISIALGILGAMLFQSVYDMIERAVSGEKVRFEVGGMTFMGGLITGVLVFILGTVFFAKGKVKRGFFACASYAAPCIVLGHFFGRIGCFCAGCCYGKATDGPLGVRFPDLPHKVLPTQLFEALFLAALLAVMLVLLFRFNQSKLLLPLYGFAYALFRFCIEFARGDERGTLIPGLTPSQTQSLLLFAVAAVLTVFLYKLKKIPFANAPLPEESGADEPKIKDNIE